MNEKLQESAVYLRCCNTLELEAFKLYETLSRKINHPESSFVLGLAYDHLKRGKIIQGILGNFDLREIENLSCRRNLDELLSEISAFSKSISRINNLNCEVASEILNELINMEELLCGVYTSYLQSSAPKFLVDEFSKLVIVNLVNFKKVFEAFVEEKDTYRETIIEVIFSLEAKETDRLRHITPVVKFQNPDAWIHESTLHAFSNAPEKASAE
ncbi:MAG TPA: hypothetical protein VK536_02250 [Candidatus Limnocylindrales bacterium]|nr:hypothetical protein [Candidatus Limnocylindrales bacterium]